MESQTLLFRRKEFLKLRLTSLCLVMFMMLGLGNPAYAQTGYSAEAQQDGFTLKKVESNTSVQSGQPFSYTIYFSIPAGATNIVITDVLPASLQYLSSSFTAPGVGSPTVSAPAVNSQGGTYSLSIASAPSGCSGSITITVQFPNGTTCNGTAARNRVCIEATYQNKNVSFCTDFITVTAIAVNPWHINKYVIGAAWVGGNCPYATGDSVVTYQLQVYKDVGTTGQLNLVNGVVRDTLPTGAILQSSTCGATQSGNVITWNVGNQSATSMFNWQTCNITILYPTALFPTNTNLLNKATLTGTLGSANASCGNVNLTSNQTCVQLLSVTKAQLSKFVYTNGQPGCASKYLIYICNTGTTSLTSFIGRDTIPTGITGVSIGTVSSGLTATLSGGIVTITSTSALAPGQCRFVEINFTIPATATVGSVITNCVTLSSTATPPQFTPQQACATFTVTAPSPAVCLWKEVCSKKTSYSPGDTVRYRLRVQNIGGQAVTGASIFDTLNPNLTYIGNPSFYTNSSWSIPCQTTSNWTGVSISYNSSLNLVTATLPSIGASCQNFFYSNCGQYGTAGVPFYFIEFDVRINTTSALGNIPNNFIMRGGTLPTPQTSNIDYVNVVGTMGFTLQKGVRTGTNTYAATTVTTAGGTVDYRLGMNIATGTAALRYITFVDELPRNNGVNDRLIVGAPLCLSRGSQFDVTYASFITSTPAIFSQYNYGTTANVNANGLTISPVGALFVGGCGTNTAWATGAVAAGGKNFAYHFGSSPQTGVVSAEFKGTVSSTAKPNETACNTFAANGAVAHLINSVTTALVKAGELESPKACITIDSTKKKCDLWEKGKEDKFCCRYDGSLLNGGGAISSIQYNVLGGSGVVQNFITTPCTPSSTVPASLLNTTTGILNFTGCTSPLNFSINAAATNTTGVVCIELIATIKNSQGLPDIICRDTVCIRCEPAPQSKCDSLKVAPYLFGNLNQSWRTFTVYNTKVPVSPIKQVRIALTPDPVPSSPIVKWTGGGLLVSPGTVNTWTVTNSNNAGSPIEYSLIDLKCTPTSTALLNNSTAVTNWVQFNLGIDYTRNWAGTVTVTTIHCDGDTCINTYSWCAKQDPKDCKKVVINTGTLTKDSIKTRLFASRFILTGEEKVKIAFATIEPELVNGARVFTIGASEFGINEQSEKSMKSITGSSIFSGKESRYAAMIQFGEGLPSGEIVEIPIVVEVPSQSNAKNVKLKLTLYDENADIIHVDSIIASSITTGIDDSEIITGKPYSRNAQLYPAEPTPTGNTVQFSYWLAASQNVTLELYDALGKNLAQIDNGIRQPGNHNFKYDASNLPSGAYLLLLTTPYGVYSQPVIVQH